LILLDDVFSELDPSRASRLIDLLPVGQTLVTTATPLADAFADAFIVDVRKNS
jgi:recombinational DNA repair ATPase RecF